MTLSEGEALPVCEGNVTAFFLSVLLYSFLFHSSLCSLSSGIHLFQLMLRECELASMSDTGSHNKLRGTLITGFIPSNN